MKFKRILVLALIDLVSLALSVIVVAAAYEIVKDAFNL